MARESRGSAGLRDELKPASAPWSSSAADVLEALAVDPRRGLSGAEADARRHAHGPNVLQAVARRGALRILAEQFDSIVVLLLVAAAGLAFLLGDAPEGAAILAVVVINAAIGFLTEWRATRSMEALRRMGRVETLVLRDGREQRVPAESLVPGDIVRREAGDIVTADLRIVEAAKLAVNEAALTGEAMPVRKGAEAVAADAALPDRVSMLYKGTAVTRGTATGVVVATGRATELGRIADLVAAAEPEETPLEKRLDALGARLAKLVAVVAVLVAGIGVLSGRDLLLAVEVAVALAVAAIPEGLPVVATIALARGMWRMARRNALIARLSAVETLGTTTVIVTDKTGTLTENRMTATEMVLGGARLALADAADDAADLPDDLRSQFDEALTVGVLCSTAVLVDGDEPRADGDPTEAALLLAALRCGVPQQAARERFPLLRELPFDPDTKLMATLHRDGEQVLAAVKGAPEAVIARIATIRDGAARRAADSTARNEALAATSALAGSGLRTLALASRRLDDPGDDPFEDLELLGIVGLEDPARPGVAEAIARCRAAGIRVVMLTGDHATTAREIARDVGIVDDATSGDSIIEGAALDALLARLAPTERLAVSVVARATPEQKLALVEHLQQRGDIVAMTGDGVNDAPALRKADIGVAMGIRGTPVAREASAMVLGDDDFGSIVEAVAQGRAIYENIRKFVVYLLSCNISEVLIVALATLAGGPLPLLPLQILFLNLVTDVFPALALGVGEGAPALMRDAPRPSGERLLTRRHWFVIGAHGLTISAATLAAMATAILLLDRSPGEAVTVSFCTLALAQLWHVFNMRDTDSGALVNEISRNRWVWCALVLCLGLILVAVYQPGVARILSLSNPGADGWLVIAIFSLVPLVAGTPLRLLARRLAAA